MGWKERSVMGSLKRTQTENSSLFMIRSVRRHTISFPTAIRSRYVSCTLVSMRICVIVIHLCLLHCCAASFLQFHYNLGKRLHSVCEGKDEDVGDTILLIVSQINHGKELIKNDDELCMPIAKLNMAAGKKAIARCDHKIAYSYLDSAQFLLPDDHWESHYDVSLQLNFMMARAANSSCKYDEAELILQTICERARCLQDKLPTYFLLSQSKFLKLSLLSGITSFLSLNILCFSPVFIAQGKVVEAYTTSSSILAQLGETVLEAVTLETVGVMIPDTLIMYSEVYGDDWLKKKMEDTTLFNIIKFYRVLAVAAYFCKPLHVSTYFICKMVQLSLRNGVCQYTPLALMQLSSIAIRFHNAAFVR